MKENKIGLTIMAIVLFALAGSAFINGEVKARGTYISGLYAYVIGGMELIFGIAMLYSAFRKTPDDNSSS